jgi:hypothetical protein
MKWVRYSARGVLVIVDTVLWPVSAIAKLILGTIRFAQDQELPNLDGPLGVALHPTHEDYVDESTFPLLVRFGMRAFPDCGLTEETRAEMYRRWLAANPNTLRFITVTDEQTGTPVVRRIGYTCLLPLKTFAYQQYRRLERSEYTFGEADIVRPTYPFAVKFVCIQAFAIDEAVSRTHLVALYQSVARLVHLFSRFRRPIACPDRGR